MATEGGARSEGTVRYGGAGDAEIAWEEAIRMRSEVGGYGGATLR